MNTRAETVTSERQEMPAMASMFLRLLESMKTGSVELTTPDGAHFSFRGTMPGPEAQLVIRDWSACAAILRSGDIGVAESYRDGKIETHDLLSVLLLALANQDIMEQTLHGSFWGTVLYRLRHLLNRNTRQGSKKNIHTHYDIGNSFYRLWLDESMTYSAGIFATDSTSLEASQYAKYDRILEAMELKRGDHVLEIGCGWGGFAEYAATQRGCRVTGVSLSRQQLDWACERVRGTGAEGKTCFEFRDYRDISGSYDAVVSIEMFEAVGEAYWPSYFRKIRDCLRPGGRAAIQTITIADERFADYRSGTDFIQQFIFPGGMLPSPGRFTEEAANAGMNISDVFDFGMDYATTLRRWRHNFENNLAAIRALGFDEAFIRIWRFYLCYCEAGFLTARTSVRQAILALPGDR